MEPLETFVAIGVWGNFVLQSLWFYRTKDKH